MRFSLFIYLRASTNTSISWCGQSNYGNTEFDMIDISNERIIVSGKRSRPITLHQVLYNTSSTLNLQITKSLAFYYLCTGYPFDIDKIELKVDNMVVEDETDFRQPFTKQLDTFQIMNVYELQSMFSLTDKRFLTSLVYYINGVRENSFDNLWRSFNSLYSIIIPSGKEFDKLVGMRAFIETHPTEFALTLAHISLDTAADIRKLRIREFILNNWESIGQINTYVETIKRFSDARIIQVFNDTLIYRSSHLKSAGKEVEVTTHIANCLSSNNQKDKELLCFYVLKYGYFIRNKYFHAEKADPYFLLKVTSETEEMNKLADVFSWFLADLIRCNKLYL